MPTNPYINNYYARNEQNLVNQLVVESIQMKGLDLCYIPRSQPDIDYLFNEDPETIYQAYTKIEMYPMFVDGFGGEGDLYSMFGNMIQNTGTFALSKTRFEETFPDLIRPREGDLLYMPITNAVLEIKFIEDSSPFFEKGKQYVYEVKVETFTYSHEEIEQGSDEDVDAVLDLLRVDNHDEEVEEHGDNQFIDQDDNAEIEFDPSNPFGVR